MFKTFYTRTVAYNCKKLFLNFFIVVIFIEKGSSLLFMPYLPSCLYGNERIRVRKRITFLKEYVREANAKKT